MKKKITQLRWLAATLMLVAAMVMPSVAWAQNTITYSKPSGAGTESSPYEIGTAAELYWFAALVIGDTEVEGVKEADPYACATLTADITVNTGVLKSDATLADNSNGFDAWTPIGSEATPYRGTFDGNNHTISGLYFNDVYSAYAGLFGCNAGKIINVGVIDSYFKGSRYVGGVCGYNYAFNTTATIKNCYNTGTISGSDDEVGGVCGCNYADSEGTSTINNCYNTGMVSSSSRGECSFGGVCGKNYANSNSTATIESSYNTGTVSGKGDYAGGVCGKNYAYDSSAKANIKYCYNTGTVSGNYAGGVCGQNYADPMTYEVTATIESCYSTGTISGNYVGGICGQNYTKSNDGSSCAIISKCYYNSYFYTGNAVGNNNYGSVSDVEGKITAQFMSGEVCYLLNGGYTNSVPWHQNLSAENRDACPVPVVEGTTANTVYQVDQHCSGGCNVGKTYANNNEAVTLDHHIQSRNVSFNSEKKIYNIVCKGEGCGYAFNYYADAAGTIKATPNDEATAFTVASYTLTDAEVYDSKAEFTVTSLAYKRTFSHDKWVAVYVPFEINCDNLANDFEMAVVNNFHEYEQTDGSYNVVLEVKRMTSGTIPALTPCVMRLKTEPAPATEKEIQLSNVPFSAAADNYIDCSSVTRYYKFTGSLAGKAANSLNGETDFVLNEGTLHKANTETTLKAQRWYLTATGRNGSSTSATMLRSITLRVIGDSEGDVTGIEDVHVVTEKATSARDGIFDLQGRRLNSEPTKGMYIKNGVKYVK